MSVVLQRGPQTLTVAMQPNTSLAEALDQFCKKYGLDTKGWKLMKEKKNMDLSVPWRLLGLVNLSVLTVMETDNTVQEVNIGLQIPAGGRIVNKFPSNTTLWEVLRLMEMKHPALNFTTQASTPTGKEKEPFVPLYMQPAVVYMSREIATNPELRATTLASIGLTGGNGLLKFIYKPTTLPHADFIKTDQEGVAGEVIEREKAEAEHSAKVESVKQETQKQDQLDSSARAKLRAEQEKEWERQIQVDKEKERIAAEKARQNAPPPSQAKPSQPQQTQQRPQPTGQIKPSQPPQTTQHKPQQPPQKAVQHDRPPLIPQQQERPQKAGGQPPPPTMTQEQMKAEMMEKLYQAQGPKPPDPTLNMIRMEVQKQELERLQKKQAALEQGPIVRNPVALAPSTKPFSPASVALPANFFNVVGGDVKKKDEQIFKSKAESKLEREQIYDKYKRFYIRIRFPDKTELQGEFAPHEKAESLFQFIQESLGTDRTDWYLFTAPPMQKLDRHGDKPFSKLGFVPAVLVHFDYDDQSAPGPYLKPELAAQLKEKVTAEPKAPVVEPTPAPDPAGKQPQRPQPGDKKPGQPNWLKLGKK